MNEPDEGRYAEIAREMIELKDLLVPRLWYQPHLDKPPLTLKPLGSALRQTWSPGVVLICWGRPPQALPSYAHPVISATNRPYLGGVVLNQMPFEFPGNLERFGDRCCRTRRR